MTNQPPAQPPVSGQSSGRPTRRHSRAAYSPNVLPGKLMSLMVGIYAIAGLFLSVFMPPFWVWPLALGGTFLQALALAGPQALLQLTRWQARGAVLLGSLGAGCLVVALAIATNYAGTDNVDEITLGGAAFTVFALTLLALLLTFGCALMAAKVGDSLLRNFDRTRSGLIVASGCFFGLFVGGVLGLAIGSA
jgi:hypothetical protein